MSHSLGVCRSMPTRQQVGKATEMSEATTEQRSAEVQHTALAELDNLPGLPAAPANEECPEALLRQIESYMRSMRENGETVTQQLRAKRDFASPDILATFVKRHGIQEYATNVDTSVWNVPGDDNPNGLRQVCIDASVAFVPVSHRRTISRIFGRCTGRTVSTLPRRKLVQPAHLPGRAAKHPHKTGETASL